MTAGLVQLSTFGAEDIFLTGAPEITFFKLVYRRYTNFAVESIPQHFIGIPNFGQEMSSIIDKAGDLINRVYLEIELPKIDLIKKQIPQSISKQQLSEIEKYYQRIYDYVSINTEISRNLKTMLKTSNLAINKIQEYMSPAIRLPSEIGYSSEVRKGLDTKLIDDLISSRTNLQNYISTTDIFDTIENLMDDNESRFILVQKINTFDIKILFDSIVNKYKKITGTEALIKKHLIEMIDTILYKQMKDFYMKIYHIYVEKKNEYKLSSNNSLRERYHFAWVEEIGHAIIECIELQIGGQVIDKHTGDWLMLFNKLYLQEYQVENYHKMIGHIKELTIFNDSIKGTYKLVIPLQFWFCRHTGQSLPIIPLRYHDVMFVVKLRELSKLCYIGSDEEIDMPNFQAQYNINIENAKLYVDYIYLDTDERKRFAQSSHEYLIEIVQYDEFDDISSNQYNASLNFSHPTKYIVWFVQPKYYRENITGLNKCQWNNFGTNMDKTNNPLESAYLRLNSYDRTNKNFDMKYYNYLQPLQYFKNSPPDGINVYSFAIDPTIHQPSASLNLSKIDEFSIIINLKDEFIKLINNPANSSTGAYMGVYVLSYNILRMVSGISGVAFK